MAGMWENALAQARVWKAGTGLGSADPRERAEAIEAMVNAGDVASLCLRFHFVRQASPRSQFAAAVALHRLGNPRGMATLLDGINRVVIVSPETAEFLELAFLTIGPPDATRELISFWPTLPEWSYVLNSIPDLDASDHATKLTAVNGMSHKEPAPDFSPRVHVICRILAGLRDPTALDTLIAYAPQMPNLFPGTVAAFGQLAMRKLTVLLRDPDPARRMLAIRALELIPGEASFQAVVPCLRDSSLSVRNAVPHALSLLGTPKANGEAIVESIQAGYSTEAALQLLATTGHPRFYDTLDELARSFASLRSDARHSPQSVQTAFVMLVNAPRPTGLFLDLLCSMLASPLETGVKLASLRHLSHLQVRCSTQAERVQAVCWELLADVSAEVRSQAAETLFVWGERNGRRFLGVLEECRPQGSLLEKLTTLLRGGPDATQAAAQAVQQVQQWVNRISREAAVRLNSITTDASPNVSPLFIDARLPALVRSLLTASLRSLRSTQELQETEEALALCISAMRALRRIDGPDAKIALPELMQALHLTRHMHLPPSQPIAREIGEAVREEAALTLIVFLGTESLPLFLEALSDLQVEVVGTAILALGKLGDPRAVSHLQPIASNPDSPLVHHAIQAISAIRQSNPEMMTLLRGSSIAEAHPETLLRPVPFTVQDSAPELLLRPAQGGEGAA